MGLDCSYGAFSGAYSAFNRFRKFILKAIGGSCPPHDDKSLDSDSWYWDTDAYNEHSYLGLYEFLRILIVMEKLTRRLV